MTVNWFPGHMVRARREIGEQAELVDVVIEVVDARAPVSTANPDLPELVKGKPVVRVLNKADLADADATRRFVDHFRRQGLRAVGMDALHHRGRRELLAAVEEAFRPVAEKLLQRRSRLRPARAMVVGVPNVGKSSVLNLLAGHKAARTGAKPGLTRGRQWVRVRSDLELLDTPGLLWPKVESEEQGLKLALLAVVGERAYRDERVAAFLLEVMHRHPSAVWQQRYGATADAPDRLQQLEAIGRQRGFLLKGGSVDLARTARVLIEEFRRGALGRITLDPP